MLGIGAIWTLQVSSGSRTGKQRASTRRYTRLGALHPFLRRQLPRRQRARRRAGAGEGNFRRERARAGSPSGRGGGASGGEERARWHPGAGGGGAAARAEPAPGSAEVRLVADAAAWGGASPTRHLQCRLLLSIYWETLFPRGSVRERAGKHTNTHTHARSRTRTLAHTRQRARSSQLHPQTSRAKLTRFRLTSASWGEAEPLCIRESPVRALPPRVPNPADRSPHRVSQSLSL